MKELKSLASKLGLAKDIIQSQQEYARKRIYFEFADITELVQEVIQMQRTSLERHKVSIQTAFQETPKVRLQRLKMSHILLNLIENAKDAMQHNDIRRKVVTFEIGTDLGSNCAFLKVTDSGVGVDEEHIDQVFNQGFTTKETGHGYGLHFCANAMAEMNGTIRIDSKGKNQGTTFTLLFPISA